MGQISRTIFCGLILILLVGCGKSNLNDAEVTQNCKGIYYSRSQVTGELEKYDETYNSILKSCVGNPLALTNFEKTKDERDRKAITCTPQPDLPSMALKASGNYYSVRDRRYFIELNASTGEYRTLAVGEYRDGRPVIERQIGCYYLRTDNQSEPINPRDYGKMIDFSFENAASSAASSYDQVFNYVDTGADFELVDPSPTYRGDWSYDFCPYQSVPWGFCNQIKAYGNILYLPSLTTQQQADLLNEAILIRSRYGFSKIASAEFQSKWDQYDGAGTSESDSAIVDESYTSNWKYRINFLTDPNPYTADSWIDFMKGERPYMPDLYAPN